MDGIIAVLTDNKDYSDVTDSLGSTATSRLNRLGKNVRHFHSLHSSSEPIWIEQRHLNRITAHALPSRGGPVPSSIYEKPSSSPEICQYARPLF